MMELKITNEDFELIQKCIKHSLNNVRNVIQFKKLSINEFRVLNRATLEMNKLLNKLNWSEK